MDGLRRRNDESLLVIGGSIHVCRVQFWSCRSGSSCCTARHQGCWVVLSYTCARRHSSVAAGLGTSHDLGWDRWQEIPSQWGDYSEKCLWGKSHSLFLQRSLSAGTKVATCRLTRVGAASWVNSNNQINLTATCICWVCVGHPTAGWSQASCHLQSSCHHAASDTEWLQSPLSTTSKSVFLQYYCKVDYFWSSLKCILKFPEKDTEIQ